MINLFVVAQFIEQKWLGFGSWEFEKIVHRQRQREKDKTGRDVKEFFFVLGLNV